MRCPLVQRFDVFDAIFSLAETLAQAFKTWEPLYRHGAFAVYASPARC